RGERREGGDADEDRPQRRGEGNHRGDDGATQRTRLEVVRRIEPDADRRPGERPERQEIAPRESERSETPAGDRRHGRARQRDHVIEAEEDEVDDGQAGGDAEPAAVQKVQRRPHGGQVELLEILPAEKRDGGEEEERPEAPDAREDPQPERRSRGTGLVVGHLRRNGSICSASWSSFSCSALISTSAWRLIS